MKVPRPSEMKENGMILLKFNRPDFEYDVQALAKSFFPGQAVGAVRKEEPLYTINIDYLPNVIDIEILGPRGAYKESVPVDFSDRRETKDKLKRLLYLMLKKETGAALPWGTLSGIRPTKIPLSLLEQGYEEDYIRAHMRENYFISEEKGLLSIKVAKCELELLKNVDYKNAYSLYIGIPFCPTTCSYCSFTSYPISKYQGIVSGYMEALGKEIDFAGEALKKKKLNTLYIGGGTPTALSHEQLDWLLGKITRTFNLDECLEITVEAGRPDSITAEKLKVLKSYGIDRISINPQTMKQATLDLIGRKHTVKDVESAFFLTRDYGFGNINMDFIVGLPGETYEDVSHTMEQALRLKPDCITIHSLAIKRAAKLNTDKELYKDYEYINNEETMQLTGEYAKKMHLEPYYLYRQKNMAGNMENVGYAARGKAGIYNILMMEEKQSIMALGAGAISKAIFPGGQIERVGNVKNVEQYIDRIDEMIERKMKDFC